MPCRFGILAKSGWPTAGCLFVLLVASVGWSAEPPVPGAFATAEAERKQRTSDPARDTAPNVAPNPSFELDLQRLGGWLPVGVVTESGPYGIEIVEEVSRTGRRSLQILPGPLDTVTGTSFFADYNGGEGQRKTTAPGGVRGARTVAMRLERDIATISTSAWIRRAAETPVTIYVVWTTRRDREPVVELRRDVVTKPARELAGWEEFELQADVPDDAHQLQLWIETQGTEPVLVDDVVLRFHRRSQQQLLVDQLGYEADSLTKRVVLQSSDNLADVAEARIVDLQTTDVVLTADWTAHGYLPSWDRYHWTAEFSSLRRPGKYVIKTETSGNVVVSPPFAVGDKLFESHAAALADRFYYYQRCGCEVPGFHAACHLDDAQLADGTWKDLTGGWHDAGDYNKYNGLTPEAVWALAFAYHRKPQLFAGWDRDDNGRPDILDEAWWGARFVRKMLDPGSLELIEAVSSGYRYWGPPEKETDNRPGTGDERPIRPGKGDPSYCVAGFALLGKYLAEDPQASPAAVAAGHEYLALAERMFARSGGGIERLVPLYVATVDDRYREAARDRVGELLDQQRAGSVVGFRELAFFAIAFPDDPLVQRIRPLAVRRVAELQAMCDHKFGVFLVDAGEGRRAYCKPYADVNDWYVGGTS